MRSDQFTLDPMKFKPTKRSNSINSLDAKRIAWLSQMEGQTADEIAKNLSRTKKDVREYLRPKFNQGQSLGRLLRLKNEIDSKDAWRIQQLSSGDPLKRAVASMSVSESQEFIRWINEWFDRTSENELSHFQFECHFEQLEELPPEHEADPFEIKQ